MSGSYAVGANYLSFTIGSAGATGSGAYTIAVLAQPAVGNNNAGLAGVYTSGSVNRSLFEDANHLFATNDFSSGFGTLVQGSWYLCAQTKAAGSNTRRHHLWAYDSGGAGSMSHGVSVGSSAVGDGSAATEIRIGAVDVSSNGLIAVVGLWTSALADATLDTLVSVNLSSWTAASPAELISLETWNGTSGASVVTGTSSFSAVTGTVSSGANPPSFNFSVGGGTTVLPAQPLVAPSPAAVRASTW